MPDGGKNKDRTVDAFHGQKDVTEDPNFESELSEYLSAQYDPEGLFQLYARFATGDSNFDVLMRRTIWWAASSHSARTVIVPYMTQLTSYDSCCVGICLSPVLSSSLFLCPRRNAAEDRI